MYFFKVQRHRGSILVTKRANTRQGTTSSLTAIGIAAHRSWNLNIRPFYINIIFILYTLKVYQKKTVSITIYILPYSIHEMFKIVQCSDVVVVYFKLHIRINIS